MRNIKYVGEMLLFLLFIAVFMGYSRIFYLPIYPGQFLLQTIGSVLFLYWLFSNVKKRSSIDKQEKIEIRLPLLVCHAITFGLWALFSALWAEHTWITGNGIVRISIFMTICIGIYHIFQRFPALHVAFWDIAMVGITICGAGYFLSILLHEYDIQGKFGFPFANPNLAGTILGFGAVLSFFSTMDSFFPEKQKSPSPAPLASLLLKFCPLIVTAFLVFLMVVCQSKSALLSWGISCMIGVYILFPKRRRLVLSLFFSMLCGAIVVFSLCPYVWKKIVDALWPSLEIRILVWKGTWAMICHSYVRFVIGWGMGNFFSHFPDFQTPELFSSTYGAEIVDFPHNFFLEIFSEHGAIGWAIFVSLIWHIARRCKKIYEDASHGEKRTAVCLLAGLAMLLCDAQFSISFSYTQTQFLLAAIIAWLAVKQPHSSNKINTEQTLVLSRASFTIFSVMAIVAILFLAKYYAWDYGKFYIQYKKARQAMPNERTKKMLDVSVPVFENFHSIQWRNDLGATILDRYEENSKKMDELLEPFDWLENKMPKFGHFWMYKAILLTKRGNYKEAQKFWLLSAKRNPFSHHLWIYWAAACKNGQADIHVMMETVRGYATDNSDGAILLGEALAWHILGDKNKTEHCFQEVESWAAIQMAKRPTQRVSHILDWAKQYQK